MYKKLKLHGQRVPSEKYFETISEEQFSAIKDKASFLVKSVKLSSVQSQLFLSQFYSLKTTMSNA